jgi:hypothetical protein
MRIIACLEDAVVIQKILAHLKKKHETWEPFPLPKAGRRLEHYSADAIVLIPPRMLFPGGTGQGTGWPPAWNGVDTALAGEAMTVGDNGMERDFGP